MSMYEVRCTKKINYTHCVLTFYSYQVAAGFMQALTLRGQGLFILGWWGYGAAEDLILIWEDLKKGETDLEMVNSWAFFAFHGSVGRVSLNPQSITGFPLGAQISVRIIYSKNPSLCGYYLKDECAINQQRAHSWFRSWNFMPLVFGKIISEVES